MDPAPYMPSGKSYGYSMSQYQVKKKSGHSSPERRGEMQPITSHTMTYWHVQMFFSFSTTLYNYVFDG